MIYRGAIGNFGYCIVLGKKLPAGPCTAIVTKYRLFGHRAVAKDVGTQGIRNQKNLEMQFISLYQLLVRILYKHELID